MIEWNCWGDYWVKHVLLVIDYGFGSMYRLIPAHWLSPWEDKQEGQIYWRPMKWKAALFIWTCLALQPLKIKRGNKNKKWSCCFNWKFGELHFVKKGEQWILLLESYTKLQWNWPWLKWQANTMLVHNTLVAEDEGDYCMKSLEIPTVLWKV